MQESITRLGMRGLCAWPALHRTGRFEGEAWIQTGSRGHMTGLVASVSDGDESKFSPVCSVVSPKRSSNPARSAVLKAAIFGTHAVPSWGTSLSEGPQSSQQGLTALPHLPIRKIHFAAPLFPLTVRQTPAMSQGFQAAWLPFQFEKVSRN